MGNGEGPLGSHLTYLQLVALPNCVDYHSVMEKQKRQRLRGIPASCERLRRFLNAVDSLDNVLDSFFHEHKSQQGWADQQLSSVRKNLRGNHPVLANIHELSIAFRQSPTRSKRNATSSGCSGGVPTLQLSVALTTEWFDYVSAEDEAILDSAYHFWAAYEKDPRIEFLLQPAAGGAPEEPPEAGK